MDRVKVLLAEDEESLAQLLAEGLSKRGYEVHVAADGRAALSLFQEHDFHLLILDIMMPFKDGYTLVQEIRQLDLSVPVVFLSARTQAEDVVKGFRSGANDYLKKPFSMAELEVRMENLLLRSVQAKQVEAFQIGSYHFDFQKQCLKHGKSGELPLTYREAQLLLQLCRNKNKVLDRSLVLNKLWGKDDFFSARSMDVFITKLRKKLDQDQEVQILNVRGYGYKLVC